MPTHFWTEDDLSKLAQMWADGHSYNQIAAALGTSRSAVAGKIYRQRLPAPAGKVTVVINRKYERQPEEVKLANSRERQRRYKAKKRAQKRAEMREKFAVRNGTSTTSAVYRRRLPLLDADITKGELRAMLALAVQNTAAL